MSALESVDAMLRELADDPSEYEREGGVVLFTRQGRDFDLRVKEMPGVGLAIESVAESTGSGPTPVSQFVQRSVLDLPRLASQIVRTLEKASQNRPTGYVDGPARLSADDLTSRDWSETAREFTAYINEQESGTTRLVQLTADAGQGKTVLLEKLACESASRYVPDPYPAPFVLPVDLLGRYVGTVDDAIAGSLNNTYRFPGLTQRDVALCLRNRWMVLALDGFDELVARVGSRDAFLRITELLDQLDDSGTVILSARAAFFELYQVSAAIRSYLQPLRGSYTTSMVRLLSWGEEQGRRVFASLGSPTPSEDLSEMLKAFGDDRVVVLQPFFLTRLASLWRRGERFSGGRDKDDSLWRTQFIIQTFIDRESAEKWVTRDGRPLLNTEGHTELLAGIAEEMWRSGGLKLGADELKISAQLALASRDLPKMVLDDVVERAPTHAALVARERGYSFVHDRFLHYYLAIRLRDALRRGLKADVRGILEGKELLPDIVVWLDWLLKDQATDRRRALQICVDLYKGSASPLSDNTARLAGMLLDSAPGSSEVEKVVFVGDSLRGRSYKKVTFTDCSFWQLDASASSFRDCEFNRCEFGQVLLDGDSTLSGSTFTDCEFSALELPSDRQLFGPSQITVELERLGASIRVTTPSEKVPTPQDLVSEDMCSAVGKLVRLSQQACDVAEEEMQRLFGGGAKAALRVGLETGILKKTEKTTSGPRKRFVRFAVDRQLLLDGRTGRTGEPRVDGFWAGMASKFPRR